MNAPHERLQLAFAYVGQVGEAVDQGVGWNQDPWVRSAERQELKVKLAGARELLGELERNHPDVSAAYRLRDGSEITLSLARVRASAYHIEAFIMWTFYKDHHAAIDLAERAVAIQPDNHRIHAHLAAFHFELGEVPVAIDAIERAVSLDPGNLDYRAAVDQLKRFQVELPTTVSPPAFSLWRPSSWFN